MEYSPMVNVVSIHALREESDPVTLRLTKRSKNFNPHSPCGERLLSRLQLVWLGLFQSTLPLRGATPSRKRSTSTPSGFQSTLPLRGATRFLAASQDRLRNFNPHSPCGERLIRYGILTLSILFQSTLPLRGATHDSNASSSFCIFQSTLPLRGATLLFPLDF